MNSFREVLGLLDIRPMRVVRSTLLGFATLACAIGLAAASAWLIARASQHPGPAALSIAAVGVRAGGVGRAVFRYLERLSSHDVALRGMAILRERLYERLAVSDLGAVLRLQRGDLLARVGADVDAVGDLVVRGLIPALVAAVTAVATVILISVFHLVTGLILAVCLIAAGVIAPLLTALGVRRAEQRMAQARSDLSAGFHTIVDDAGPLLVAGRTHTVLDEMAGSERRIWSALDGSARFAALGTLIGNLALGVAVVAAIVFGVPDTLAGTLDPVELAVVVLTPLAAFEATSVLPMAAVQWHRSKQAAHRIGAMLAAPVAAEPAATTARTAAAEPESTPSDLENAPPELRLTDADVGWFDPAESTQRPVVTGVNIQVRPGDFIAVVGSSGIGKTTVLATLAGLIPPLAGEFEAPARASGPGTAASHVAFIPEDAHIFATTVRENLHVVAKDIPDPAALLATVGLSDWLAGLPHGLDTVLGSGGVTMSGGERRRLLLARALASPARFLLLDEPTEHLDPAAADDVIALLGDLASSTDRGIIVATHRLAALDHATEVIVLGERDGTTQIVDRGPHAQLAEHNVTYAHALADDKESDEVRD